MQLLRDRFELAGHLRITGSDAARVVSGQVNSHLVVDVEPLRMMTVGFDRDGRGRHEAEGVDEVGKAVFPVQLAIDEAPARKRGKSRLDFRNR